MEFPHPLYARIAPPKWNFVLDKLWADLWDFLGGVSILAFLSTLLYS